MGHRLSRTRAQYQRARNYFAVKFRLTIGDQLTPETTNFAHRELAMCRAQRAHCREGRGQDKRGRVGLIRAGRYEGDRVGSRRDMRKSWQSA